MEPKTKIQKQVAELSNQLPTITEKRKEWAYHHCFEHIAKRTTQGVCTCLECGHQWTDTQSKGKTIICPHCGMKLQVHTERQRVFREVAYFCILTRYKGYQVIRHYYMQVYRKQGNPIKRLCYEVVQHWLSPEGKHAVLARLRPMSCWYYDTWIFSSDLEIRPDKQLYDILPHAIYPHTRVIPELKRNGFTGNLYDLSPLELFRPLLTDSRIETLLKAEQIALLRHFIRRKYSKIEHYWASIRICLRNHYYIANGSLWCDLVDTLQLLGKDTHSPKYVCPTDLQHSHDYFQQRRRAKQEQEHIQQKRAEAQERETEFVAQKSKFFGIVFTDGTIQVRVLESVREYLEEGTAMHHCVYDNSYYSKPQSLILSATIADRRIETIEVNLETLKVVQSRGVCNVITKYHDQIVSLVQRNIGQIAQRLTA